MSSFQNLTSEKFGKLLVVERSGYIGAKIAWSCLCECGNVKRISATNLKNGHTSSCGCLQKQLQSARITIANTVHGHNKGGTGNQSRTWNSWSSMKKRCTMKKHISYKDYGGRGITFCERWKEFIPFLQDMGERPEGHTLDRIDVNGNYEPSNCRWATLSEQQKNKRKRACV